MPLIPALGRWRQEWYGWAERGIWRGKRQEFSGVWGVESGFMEIGSLHFWSMVEVRTRGWLLCFSDLQVEPQYLFLDFYYCAIKTCGLKSLQSKEFIVIVFCFLRQGFSVQPWLSWNSLWRPGWPETQRSSCLCLLSSRTKGSTATLGGCYCFPLEIF